MRIVCIGGGPAGLYLAILMKKADPAHEITVVERNRPGDTFGFGVVFSDATLETYLADLHGSGPEFGEVLVTPEGTRDGEPITLHAVRTRDADGRVRGDFKSAETIIVARPEGIAAAAGNLGAKYCSPGRIGARCVVLRLRHTREWEVRLGKIVGVELGEPIRAEHEIDEEHGAQLEARCGVEHVDGRGRRDEPGHYRNRDRGPQIAALHGHRL